MPSLTTLRGPVLAGVRSAFVSASKQKTSTGVAMQVRHGGHANTMPIKPSKYSWDKFWDDVHYYVAITAVPLGFFIAYNQIRIGPAKLVEIPEGYVPKEHEYLKDPIQRLMQKYHPFLPDLAKTYESTLFYIDYNAKTMKERVFVKKVYELNTKREDIKGWYFVPYDNTLHEETSKQLEQGV